MSNDILFDECVEALKKNVVILTRLESDKIFDYFEAKVPLVSWGRIDWNGINKKKTIEWATQIVPTLEQLLKRSFDRSINVLWNDGSVPVIKTNLDSIVTFFDDVVSVAPDTWLVNFEEGYVIEVFHDGEMTVGLIP